MSKQKKQITIPPDKLALYDKLIATNPNLERKGVIMPYTSVNGNMFTYLSPEGVLGIRLHKKEREDFLEKYHTTLYQSQGMTLKEYVTVPEELFSNTEELKQWLDKSYEYAKTLKSKASKKT
jgi:TfoX/Sxy family transcriptional regulator of competence genes